MDYSIYIQSEIINFFFIEFVNLNSEQLINYYYVSKRTEQDFSLYLI